MATKTKTGAKSTKVGGAAVTFDNAGLVKKLLAEVPERAREVLIFRFGLGTSATRETLEAIGDRWGVTRERVRQIENAGLEAVRASKAFEDAEESFSQLEAYIESLGGIVPEDELLGGLAKDEKSRNRFRFLLVVGSAFFRERETDDFYARWHVDHKTAEKVHDALTSLYSSLEDEDVLPEGELLSRFLEELKGVNTAYQTESILKRWLSLSKTIACNPLSEWGRASCSSVRTKGIRDYAYLAVKQAGKPLHFSEVAKAISDLFSKKAHVATTHNELIKDERFVLVGRGLYALKEWGYAPGIVREVVADVLKKNGPMTKEQVIAEVKKSRYVKDNTVLVNLNDTRYFKRQKNGTYALA
ncbi:MAG: sigma factor-like helix-turn-helix DNA-binding protein [bacterium]